MEEAAGTLTAYDDAARSFVPVQVHHELAGSTRYARGAAVSALHARTIVEPQEAQRLLPAVVEGSRESGIMTPSTSYIVVENSAQWQMLKLQEAKKLSASGAFELMETPEPAEWMLLVAVAILVGLQRFRRPRDQPAHHNR